MALDNVIVDLIKGETLDEAIYDIWHRKIQYLLNDNEILEIITNVMKQPIEGHPM